MTPVLVGWWIAQHPRRAPEFQQLTFLRGRIGGARFAGESIVYSQAQAGAPLGVWLTPPDGQEPRFLGYPKADVLAARSNELALSIGRRFTGGERFVGTLAIVPVSGGVPREVLENVEDGDWDPPGVEFAVARSAGFLSGSELQYPIGHKIYGTAGGSIHSPRISRDGQRVAFLEDLAGVGIGGRVVVATREGQSKVLTAVWTTARGLAWSPRGDEVWFTASAKGSNQALRAVDLEGHARLVFEAPGSLSLWDTAPDGRVLLTRDYRSMAIVGVPPGESSEKDLSWFDTPGLASLSQDGQMLLFGDRFGIYLRRTNGEPAKRVLSSLGAFAGAWADDLSPDGSLVLATTALTDRLILVPTGPGNPRLLPNHQIASYSGARFFPDSRRILFNGREAGEAKLRSYVTDLSGSPPRPLSPPDTDTIALSISPDSRLAAAIGDRQGITLWPLDGGKERRVPNTFPEERPVAWTEDGSALWVFKRNELPAHIVRIDIASGKRYEAKKLVPPDVAGVYSIQEFQITPRGHAYFYGFHRILSELYVARELR